MAKEAKAAPSEEAKKSKKGVKSFTLSGDAAKIRDVFSMISGNSKPFKYKGKTPVAQLEQKVGDKVLKGEDAVQIAMKRYYSSFGARVNKNQNPERNAKAKAYITEFLKENTTLEKQSANAQTALDNLMAIYKGVGGGKGGSRGTGVAITMNDLGW